MFARIALATHINVASFASPGGENPLVKRPPRLPPKIREGDHWSPTQQEVDTYVDSLEEDLLQSCKDMPDRLDNRYKRAAAIKDRASNHFILFWGLVAIAAGCFWELARIILKALN